MSATKTEKDKSIPPAKYFVDYLKEERGHDDKLFIESMRSSFSLIDEKLNYDEDVLDFRENRNLIYYLLTRLGEILYHEKGYVLVPVEADEDSVYYPSKKLLKKIYDENNELLYPLFKLEAIDFIKRTAVNYLYQVEVISMDFPNISPNDFMTHGVEIVVRDYIELQLSKQEHPMFDYYSGFLHAISTNKK